MAATRITFRIGDRDQGVDVLDTPEGTVVRTDGQNFRATVDGRLVDVYGAPGGPAWTVSAGASRWVYYDGCVYELEVQRDGGRRAVRHHGSLSAPMPATVRQIRVKLGDRVARGETLIVLEAMKMELPVRANDAGIVSKVLCAEGELVQPGVPLVELDAADGA
jgi:3-methylcrotonyl-CoA carboxylase alpha subunit